MARISPALIEAVRKAAANLKKNSAYQWGHMGLCNCGFLAQEVTKLTKTEIHQRAMASHGDWTEQLNDYCPSSGLPLDAVIDQLVAFGFDTDDLKHLERLSDPTVLNRLPISKRNLRHNVKTDVVLYFKTWIASLEEEWAKSVSLPALHAEVAVL